MAEGSAPPIIRIGVVIPASRIAIASANEPVASTSTPSVGEPPRHRHDAVPVGIGLDGRDDCGSGSDVTAYKRDVVGKRRKVDPRLVGSRVGWHHATTCPCTTL